MKTKIIIVFTVFITFFSCKNEVKEEIKPIVENSKTTEIQLIQFHTEHRCVTCNNIEKLSKETIKENDAISFVLYNVDDKKNEKLAEEFEATGTSLYLYNSKTKAIKDLTEMAFMYAKNEGEKFKTELQKEISEFK
ncbi:MAG: nitrophenyl compound nitroreductase subunit ArsF family protein [Flavobacterium sp.]|uniref:nitrophenyl compound nitroreductase subunit ArsF family protein n=1 Tax=Flavobacterium sp. TaxID=239 RepID=UPI0035ADBB03